MPDGVNPAGVGGTLLSWAVVGVLGGAAVLVLRLAVPSARGSLFPPQRVRFAPWRLVDLALVMLIFAGADSLFAYLLSLRPSREPDQVFAASLRADTQGMAAAGHPGGGMGVAAQLLENAVAHRFRQAEQTLDQVWHKTLSAPVSAFAILAAMVFIAGGRPYQLGITTNHLTKVLIASYVVWLIMTPLVFLVFWLVIQLAPAQQHPVETLAILSSSPLVWTLIVFSVIIAAPLLEELLFRGILQPIMVRSPEVADLTILMALVTIIIVGTFQVLDRGTLSNPWPIVILIGTGAGYLGFERLTWRWLPRPGAARAIFATSVLFAALHYAVWPTPIPLFFFSLAVGYLGYRTQSLIGPIVVHSLFNLVTVGQLLQVR